VSPFVQGLLAGYGIAIPVGGIAVLIVDAALRRGFRRSFFAAAGAATADLICAVGVALAGGVGAQAMPPAADALRSVFVIGLGARMLLRS